MSSTLRPHRSPSPSPSTPVNPGNPAKLTRQSLGPPTATGGTARGFSGLGISGFNGSQPRHVSSSVALGHNPPNASPRPSLNSTTPRAASGPRPSSEFLPGARDARTPEAEQIDQWFKHLASWEATLEEMAAASTDQNFTEELGAIEQWFRVLSEAERTAALYSLLQHSTPVQIRFFLSVLHHMAQSDPMTALLSPNPNQSLQAQMESKLKSPLAGGGSGFPGSPGSHFLAPEAALDPSANKAKLRQNRISAPGTLQPSDRWQGQLDQVAERGSSPGLDSNRSSPAPDVRPKSTDFGTLSAANPPMPASSPLTSPFLNNGSWASMTSTPLVPMFTDPKIDGNAVNAQLAAQQGRIALDDARKYRRNGNRNVSAQYNDEGEMIAPQAQQPGRGLPGFARSPVLDQYGLGDPATLAGLGMSFANLNMNPLANSQFNAAQMLAMQQLSTAASFAQSGYGGGAPGLNVPRSNAKPPTGRKSPMLGKSHSPIPGSTGGAGVAGPDDVESRVIEDVGTWLRVLRLHKYTTNFEKSNWKDMVKMTDNDLQDKGVSAQGARTKFLKVFYNVRTKYELPHPPGQEEYAPAASDK